MNVSLMWTRGRQKENNERELNQSQYNVWKISTENRGILCTYISMTVIVCDIASEKNRRLLWIISNCLKFSCYSHSFSAMTGDHFGITDSCFGPKKFNAFVSFSVFNTEHIYRYLSGCYQFLQWANKLQFIMRVFY